MRKFYFIIDESGAKGYADNQEQYLGELGLIAGYVIPEEYITEVKEELAQIRDKYASNNKLHITELSPEQQQNLRNDIFNYFMAKNIYIMYEAIHVQGFFNNQKSLFNLINQAKETTNPNISFSKNETLELLHKQLFQGLVGKAIGMCYDIVGKYFHLDIISDNIDKSIQKEFAKAIDELISFGEKKTKNTTAYDKKKKTVLRGSISSEIENAKNIFDDYSNITYSISCEDSELTLASDVLANSLYYHFKQRSRMEKGTHLNTVKAVEGFILKDFIYGLWNDDDLNYYADAIFMHPEEEKKLKINNK